MEKKIFCLLFFSATLMLGSGCGNGTGSPPDSAAPGILENRTVSEDLDRPEDSHPSVLGKNSTLLHGPGTLTVKVARAGSVLPPGTWGVFLTFDEVSVYKEDEGWVSLPLKHDPYRIELFRLPLGEAAALTDPAELPPGKYSRIRIARDSPRNFRWLLWRTRMIRSRGQDFEIVVARRLTSGRSCLN